MPDALLRHARAKARAWGVLRRLRRDSDVDYIQDPDTGRFDGSRPGAGGDDGGGGSGGGGDGVPNAEAVDVGGDQWNKQTAARLEQEYAEVKKELSSVASDAVDGSATPAPQSSDDNDEDVVADEWAAMGDQHQEQAKDAYLKDTYENFFQSEVDNWKSETAPDDARYKVANDFTEANETEWASKAIDEYREWRISEGMSDIPFTTENLIEALAVNHETGQYPIIKGTDIAFNDASLKSTNIDEAQATLPGIAATTPADMLTKEMREDLLDELGTAFTERASEVESDLEPPEYLSDSVAEFQSEAWDQMDDKEKFAWVEANTEILGGAGDKAAALDKLDKLPGKYDPLEANASAADYKRTQLVARHLSIARAADLMVKRGVISDIAKAKTAARDLDKSLWDSWKSNSHSPNGMLLQAAVHEELGGRLHGGMVSVKDAQHRAGDFAGGYNAVKAYVRAKWETTQFLLDKAGVQTVNVYRAVNIADTAPPVTTYKGGNTYEIQMTHTFDTKAGAQKFLDDQAQASDYKISGSVTQSKGNTFQANVLYKFEGEKAADNFVAKQTKENPLQHSENVYDKKGLAYDRLPDIHITRNGAASTTTDPKVANDWNGSSGRVVVRASVPRTAVISVPAFGQNVHSEHEVVVAGTAWKGWDAWYGRAPTFDAVAIGHQIAAT